MFGVNLQGGSTLHDTELVQTFVVVKTVLCAMSRVIYKQGTYFLKLSLQAGGPDALGEHCPRA